MAFTTTSKFIYVATLLILALMILHQNFEANKSVTGNGWYHSKAAADIEKHSRKVLSEKRVLAVVNNGKSSSISSSRKEEEEEEEGLKKKLKMGSSELRMVPSGPDPLHHNTSPKKPRTSP